MVNPYEEMNEPYKEVMETLPDRDIVLKEPSEEVKEDYLDKYSGEEDSQNNNYSQPVMFDERKDENLIKDLLNVNWERIEHILRGHKPKVDEKGNEYFIMIEHHYLNDYGVNNILHFLSFYLSKEIFLARYTQEKVNLIMKQFSMQFTNWFYDNINEFGLNTPTKKKMSNMFVRAIIDLVDAAYSKSVEGRMSEMVFKQFQVLQNQPIESHSSSLGVSKPKTGVFSRIFG